MWGFCVRGGRFRGSLSSLFGLSGLSRLFGSLAPLFFLLSPYILLLYYSNPYPHIPNNRMFSYLSPSGSQPTRYPIPVCYALTALSPQLSSSTPERPPRCPGAAAALCCGSHLRCLLVLRLCCSAFVVSSACARGVRLHRRRLFAPRSSAPARPLVCCPAFLPVSPAPSPASPGPPSAPLFAPARSSLPPCSPPSSLLSSFPLPPPPTPSSPPGKPKKPNKPDEPTEPDPRSAKSGQNI